MDAFAIFIFFLVVYWLIFGKKKKTDETPYEKSMQERDKQCPDCRGSRRKKCHWCESNRQAPPETRKYLVCHATGCSGGTVPCNNMNYHTTYR